jgi:environmental stress-induced protein Ves
MTDYQLYSPEHFVKLRWKNGLGYTTELLKESLDKNEFAWRLSIAQVSQDGPFSNFEGYERTLLLLKGQGITLEQGDGSRQVLSKVLDAARFSGKGPTIASLHEGPIEDFNIMTRNGVCSARTHTGADTQEFVQTIEANLLLIYASVGSLKVNLDGAEFPQIPAAHLLRVNIDEALPLHITGSGYIAVEIFDSGGLYSRH